jgi:Mn-dependent DtxR family transcriptional regulator
MILKADPSTNSGVIHLRRMRKGMAKQLIHEFITRNPGSMTSEIIERLRIDPVLAVQTLKELKQDDSVISKPLE